MMRWRKDHNPTTRRSAINPMEQDFENATDLKLKIAMAKHAALSVAAAILQVPVEVYTTPPMMDPNPPSTQEERRIRHRIVSLLEKGWDPMDGFDIPSRDVEFVNDTMNATRTDHNPSTYGEVTELGARQLFHYMGIAQELNQGKSVKNFNTRDSGVNFFDLGCGNGKLVIQAFMEVSSLKSSRGVELAPSRLRIAKQAWHIIKKEAVTIRQDLASFKNKQIKERSREKESVAQVSLDEGDLFLYDISDATHIYVASLCFTEDMMKGLGRKIIHEATSLSCIATLKRFPVEVEERLGEPRQEFVEMSWTKARGQGGVVYFYQMLQ